ncbi:GntR family transcriptional regulator [Aquipuribacter sp. MA13-6]|uniref:GntR family transcriptional regulator n=1 Tax=unclassified Aquipuribacter TaxID=2635084 RepID=UPI003EE8BDAE
MSSPAPSPLLQVDLLSPTPPYEQVRRQVAAHVSAGTLRPGQRLPTVRELAGRLGLSPNTVARAYRELERDGLVTTRRRVGTVVTAAPAGPAPADGDGVDGLAAVHRAAATLARAALAADLDDSDVLTIAHGALLRARADAPPPVPSP